MLCLHEKMNFKSIVWFIKVITIIINSVKNTALCKVQLDCDLFIFQQKKAKGQELLDLVFKNLDLVEKDYFGLQFMDTHQVSVWETCSAKKKSS